MKRRSGLQTRVLLATAAIVLLFAVLLLVAVYLERSSRDHILALNRDDQARLVQDVAAAHAIASVNAASHSLTNAFYFFDLESIGEYLNATVQRPAASTAVAFNRRGAILVDNHMDLTRYGEPLDSPLVTQALTSGKPEVSLNGSSMQAARAVVIGDDELLGGVLIGFDLGGFEARVGESTAQLERQLIANSRNRLIALGTTFAGIALLGILLSWMVQRRIVQPILTLADAARRIESGDYNYPMPKDQQQTDEIGQLKRVFASMAAHLADSHARSLRRANFDKLTDLPNRHAFDDTIDEQVAMARTGNGTLALLYLDLDHLKRINDQFGHDAGDKALIRFAHLAGNAAADLPGGAWVARIGGDEFAALLTGEPLAQRAVEFAADIIRRCHEPDGNNITGVPLGASIGIALFPDDADNVGDLLRCADNAMYRAKNAGKNRIQLFAGTAPLPPN